MRSAQTLAAVRMALQSIRDGRRQINTPASVSGERTPTNDQVPTGETGDNIDTVGEVGNLEIQGGSGRNLEIQSGPQVV